MPKLVIEIIETRTPKPEDPNRHAVDLKAFARIEFASNEDSAKAILPHLMPLFQAAICAAISASKHQHFQGFEIESIDGGRVEQFPAEIDATELIN